MYNIIFTYLKANNITQVEFVYNVIANSYQEAIDQVQLEAEKRINKMGGSIISII